MRLSCKPLDQRMRKSQSTRPFAIAAALTIGILSLGAAAALVPTKAARESAISEAGNGAAPVTGLPVPRFVSLKTTLVNVRRGPSKEHPIAFQFQRAALPVEIIGEFENWRQIRDSEGEEGWVFHSLLSGSRTAIVAPWDHDEVLRALRTRPRPDAAIEARLEPQVVLAVSDCDGTWCAVESGGYSGYVEQGELWGVYPGERID